MFVAGQREKDTEEISVYRFKSTSLSTSQSSVIGRRISSFWTLHSRLFSGKFN